MNKILIPFLAFSVLFGSYRYDGSTTSVVTMAGGIIKAQNVEVIKKYKRKDCPVCKGTGYYISGDGIKKVDCGYCIPDKTEPPKEYPKVISHPPVKIQQNCPDSICPIPKK